MPDVNSMNSYAIVSGLWEKGTKSKEIVLDKPESLNWQDLEEAEEPIRALYSWAVETSRSFLRMKDCACRTMPFLKGRPEC